MPRNKKRNPMPVAQVPTGLPYGKRTELMQQATALPPAPQGGGTAMPPPQQAGRDPLALMGQLPQLTPLGAPTQRPGEPITAGLPIGAGAGPEALAPIARPNSGIVDMLRTLAMETGDPAFEDMIALVGGR